jgi:hypothetical protein
MALMTTNAKSGTKRRTQTDPVTDDRPLSEVFFTMSDDQKADLVRRQLADSAAGRDPTPTPREKARHDAAIAKAGRGRGRPKVGKGSKMIALSIELGLLQRVDAFAKRHKLTRARAVALILNGFLLELEDRRVRAAG